ncbi:MAG: YicC family protein [Gemmatimonadales bacterium]|nr:YicC family protein [Gemmatimonadales bacterium]
MTGFGAAEGPAGGGRLRIEIRTVNHRFFNFAPKLPNDLATLESDLRDRLRQEFDRGHIAVHGRWMETADREPELTVNLTRARMVADRLQALQAVLGLGGRVDLDLIVRQPEVLSWAGGQTVEVPWAEVEPIVSKAADECRGMRRREGGALVTELLHRLAQLEAEVAAIALRAPERLVRERDRLRAAVGELMDGRAADDGRLAQEIAFMADRMDITEELVRFRAHVAAARDALASDKPAGKQLGFLAQELGREVNTMGAKANDAEIATRGIAMKGELEKFREQLENLE